MLDVSRRNNERDELSGMMLYDRGTIIQYIEGPNDKLSATWLRIQNDNRHKGAVVCSDGRIRQRLFSRWSMGFENGERLGGFHLNWREILNRTPDHFPPIVQVMMRTFYLNTKPIGSAAGTDT